MTSSEPSSRQPWFKPRTNDRNISAQRNPTFLPGSKHVAPVWWPWCDVLRHACFVLLAHVWKWSNLSQQQSIVTTIRDRVAKRSQQQYAVCCFNNVEICCVEILRSFGRGFMQGHAWLATYSKKASQVVSAQASQPLFALNSPCPFAQCLTPYFLQTMANIKTS